MAVASNTQVQNYVDQRVRPRSEQIRALYLALKDDKASIDDVYANLTSPTPWADTRTDGPPHMLSAADVLAWNTFITGVIALVEGGSTVDMAASAAQYPKVLQACVRGV